MARYIDSEIFVQKCSKHLNQFPNTRVPLCEVAIKIGRAIKETPTADVVEVKHGYWEHIGDKFANCSNCGTIFEALPTMFGFKSNNIFCRHCGAKMDGKDISVPTIDGERRETK